MDWLLISFYLYVFEFYQIRRFCLLCLLVQCSSAILTGAWHEAVLVPTVRSCDRKCRTTPAPSEVKCWKRKTTQRGSFLYLLRKNLALVLHISVQIWMRGGSPNVFHVWVTLSHSMTDCVQWLTVLEQRHQIMPYCRCLVQGVFRTAQFSVCGRLNSWKTNFCCWGKRQKLLKKRTWNLKGDNLTSLAHTIEWWVIELTD